MFSSDVVQCIYSMCAGEYANVKFGIGSLKL